MSQTYRAIALCALGLEKVLQAELERLGFKAEGREAGRVCFSADAAGLFRANLCLRTAERVLLEVKRFPAPDFDALFEGARSAPWELFFAPEDKLVIERVRCNNSRLAAQTAVQSVAHKAIYEKLGAVHGLSRLPETGSQRSLRVYIDDDVCSMGLDLSGEALHKRGYRTASGEAPLKETIAAALLFLSGWNHKLALLDPFCGSGTLLIEAGLLGLNMAPGLDRSFAIENMPIGELSIFQAEREAARSRIVKDDDLVLVGSDEDAEVLRIARENAERAGLGGRIKFSVGKAEDAAPIGAEGLLIANPPYGERMGTEEEALDLYRRLSPLKDRFKGWGIGFVTNRADFGQYFGRRAVSEHRFLNGSEEQWFHWYPIGFEQRPERPPREAEGAATGAGARNAAVRAPRKDGAERPPRAAHDERGRSPQYEHGPRRDQNSRGGYGHGAHGSSYGSKHDGFGHGPERDSDREGRPGRPWQSRDSEHSGGGRREAYSHGSSDHADERRSGHEDSGRRGGYGHGPHSEDRGPRSEYKDSGHEDSGRRGGYGHGPRAGGYGPKRDSFGHGPGRDGEHREGGPGRGPAREGGRGGFGHGFGGGDRRGRFESDDPRLHIGHIDTEGSERRRLEKDDGDHFAGEGWRNDEVRRRPRAFGNGPAAGPKGRDQDLLSEKRDIQQSSNAGPAKPTLRKKDDTSSYERAKKPQWSGRSADSGTKKPKDLSGFGGERGPGIGWAAPARRGSAQDSGGGSDSSEKKQK